MTDTPDSSPDSQNCDLSEKAEESSVSRLECPVVGMGASAGGLAAFQKFLVNMSPANGMAFVLVQHLAPNRESILSGILSKSTSMPVHQVDSDMAVEANHVYLIPPNKRMVIQQGTLRLSSPGVSADRGAVIDNFFRSLAQDQGENAIAIILSGAGMDGSVGCRAIKQHGGLVMAQATDSTKYDSMPQSAIATGVVDYVLPIEEMPAKLIEYVSRFADIQKCKGPIGIQTEIAERLDKISSLLLRKMGHDFSQYKQSTLIRRIHRRMLIRHDYSIETYVEHLQQDPTEMKHLFKDLLIGVTHFFRDPDAFDALARDVFPNLFRASEDSIRVWVSGCSTGEEAYSLAILLREYMAKHDVSPHIQLFATDIDSHAVEIARQGRYEKKITDQMSAERLERYFVKQGDLYQVAKEVRDMCLFSTHDLLRDPPFSRLDLISCRNLLIYLEIGLQRKIIPLFHYGLRADGFLFLGSSESLSGHSKLFQPVDKKRRIFQRKETVARRPLNFVGWRPGQAISQKQPGPQPLLLNPPQPVGKAAAQILLDKYAPPYAVVNEQGEIVYVSARITQFLQLPAGVPNLNVMTMARRGLGVDLRGAILSAVRSHTEVVRKNVSLETDGETKRINLIVHPLPAMGEERGLFIVVFHEIEGTDSKGEAKGTALSRREASLVRQLEQELRETKEHLQSTIEELETANEELGSSNEELLSLNEELQSSNEEMQTSKEELQLVNEELETVNAELKKHVDDLDRAHGDLQNLFQSTQIATIFLDNDLRIKSFTPASTDIFRLLENDVGRPITDLSAHFHLGDLVQDIQEVLKTLATKERQVYLQESRTWFLMRLRPYRSLRNVIEGIVLTFVDVTELKEAQQRGTQLAAIVDSSQDAIIGKTLDGTITSWNKGAEALYGFLAEEVIGQPLSILVPLGRQEELPLIHDRLRRGHQVDPFETVRVRKDGTQIPVILSISPIIGPNRDIIGASAIAHDITDRKRAEEALRRSEKELSDFFDNASVGLHWEGPDGKVLRVNKTELDLLGYSREEYVGRHISEFHMDEPVIQDILTRLMRNETLQNYEARLRCKDGSIRNVLISSNVYRENEEFIHTRCFTRDITDRKRAEESLRESELRFRTMADAAPVLVWMSGLDKLRTYFNQPWLTFTGRTMEQELGNGWAEGVHPDDFDSCLAIYVEAFDRREPFTLEYRLRRADGAYRWILDHGVPRFGHNGTFEGNIGSCIDITDRREAEEALKAADRRKDEFLAMLAHELRNPLAPISTAVQFLKQPRFDQPDLQSTRDMIDRQVEHLTRLVDDLLDVSRVSQGKVVLRKETVELSTLVERALETSRPYIESKEHTLTVFLPKEPILVEADPIRLAQVFANLLNNAAKFSAIRGHIWLTSERQGNQVAVTVRDTGAGIAADVLPHVFDLFVQAEKSLDRSEGGLGIGLTLVRNMVELHGGTVEAASAGLGRGSEFIVRLPVLKGRGTVTGEAQQERHPQSTSSRRILVVDDNVDAAESLVMLLTLSGHDARMAHDGSTAVGVARAFRPDIVFLDIGLPVIDGYQVARQLRQEFGDRVLLVALTGYGQEEDRRRSKEAGFDHHLVKPIDSKALQTVLASVEKRK